MKSFLRPSQASGRAGGPCLAALLLAPLGVVLAALWPRLFARFFCRSTKGGL
jgi:hypothetical protein